jgi:hypothetical protein
MLCKGITKKGVKCKKTTLNNKGYCFVHLNQYTGGLLKKKFVDEKPQECIICCEELCMSAPLECGHWIHLDCVKKSLKPECPICCCDLSQYLTNNELETIKKKSDEVVDDWNEEMLDQYDSDEEVEFIIQIPLVDITVENKICEDCFEKNLLNVIFRYIV